MGSWFSNIHIRKTAELTDYTVIQSITALMEEKGYRKVNDPETADIEITVFLPPDGSWISFCSEALAHDDPESCKALLAPLSAKLHADVLGIACFDSDYLYLNLINEDAKTDGWIGIGSGKNAGISRRNSLASWKKQVANYPDFSAKVKGKYVIAEQFLAETAENLCLPFTQSTFTGECAGDNILKLCFYRTAGSTEKPVMAHYKGFPCFIGEETVLPPSMKAQRAQVFPSVFRDLM